MATDKREKQLREELAKVTKDKGKGSAASLAVRGKLNDYLAGKGQKVNRLPGEPINGKGGAVDLTTPEGVFKAQQAGAYVDETGPTGSADYTIRPDGSVTRDVTLSPEEQAKLSSEQSRDLEINRQIHGALERVNALNGDYVDTSSLTTIAPEKFDVLKIQEALMGNKRAQLEEKFARERSDFEAQLLNRGIQPGSIRAKTELQQLAQRQADEMSGAEASSYTNAGSVAGAQTGLYGAALDQRAQQYQELYDRRNQPYMDLANLSGASGLGVSSVNWPQFSGTQFVDPAQSALGFAGLASDEELARLGITSAEKIAKWGNEAQLKATGMTTAAQRYAAGLAAAGRGGHAEEADNPEAEVDNLWSPASPVGKNKVFGAARSNFNGRFF